MSAAVRTVRDLIQRAFQKLGVYASGETIPGGDMNDGLMSFQDTIAEWAADGMLVPILTQDSFTLTAGKKTYTIGEASGADISTARPEQIIDAYIRQGTTDYPIDIIDELAYNSFQDKSSQGSRPEYLYYDASSPNGSITFYRGPGTTGDTVYITSEKASQDSAGLTDDVFLDTGIPRFYHNPIIYNIAVDLAPEYGKGANEISLLISKAEAGKTRIRGLNAENKIRPASVEFSTGRRANDDLVKYN